MTHPQAPDTEASDPELTTEVPASPEETSAGDGAPLRDSDQPFRRRPGRIRWAFTALCALVLSLFCAWAANLVLDYSMWRGVPHQGGWQPILHPAGLWPSLLITWIVVVLIFALIGRLWLSMGVLGVISVFLAVVNYTKIEQRNEPLLPTDTSYLNQPGFIASFVPKMDLIGGAVGVVLAIAAAAGVGWLAAKLFPPLWRGLSRRQLWIARGVRVVVVVLCLLLLHTASNFNVSGNSWRKMYDATGLRWRDWDSVRNYQKNGFVSGLLFNMHVTAMNPPPGYSEATIRQIDQKYTALAAKMNKGRTGSLDNVNVVDILSESLSQPEWLKGVKLPENPLPNITKTMAQTVSGKTLAWGYGGGTANMEFEVLTGQSMAQFNPQLETPYEQLITHYKSYPSIVQWLTQRNHVPIAIHPYTTQMYKRVEVFKRFGFSQFIDKDTIKEKRRAEHGRYIDDQSAFDQILDEIDDHTKPVYLHVITMQNHTPYQNQYSDPIIPVSGVPKSLDKYYGQYLRGINITDAAFKRFTDQLSAQTDKPTVVIMYGDHLPPQVYPGNFIRREGLRTAHETPFLIWSNVKRFKHTTLPTTSPTHFYPMLFNAMNAPIPAYYALLDAVQKQVPAMDAGMKINATDQLTSAKDLDPAAKAVLKDYRLIQYDLSVGHRWSESTMFGNPPR
ncbi:LTA synthase family protein [Nocardioides terrisoli]|uniref:LTA synthase family protein n=1 Tax=Nocardioides terrisoli TaxID=3388267 RepID=UPI00287B78BA|nr:LTA synthase family protein [Nocardioides marmorisolisilvae]